MERKKSVKSVFNFFFPVPFMVTLHMLKNPRKKIKDHVAKCNFKLRGEKERKKGVHVCMYDMRKSGAYDICVVVVPAWGARGCCVCVALCACVLRNVLCIHTYIDMYVRLCVRAYVRTCVLASLIFGAASPAPAAPPQPNQTPHLRFASLQSGILSFRGEGGVGR